MDNAAYLSESHIVVQIALEADAGDAGFHTLIPQGDLRICIVAWRRPRTGMPSEPLDLIHACMHLAAKPRKKE